MQSNCNCSKFNYFNVQHAVFLCMCFCSGETYQHGKHRVRGLGSLGMARYSCRNGCVSLGATTRWGFHRPRGTLRDRIGTAQYLVRLGANDRSLVAPIVQVVY